MWPFKPSQPQYTIKLVERIEYRSIEQKNLDNDIQKFNQEKIEFQQEKENLIDQAKRELLDDAKKSAQILDQRQQDMLITDQEKQIYQEKLKQDPYIDLDKLPVPYYNIRQAIRRAHAY